ncbi:MAG: class I SAM-dependent methyltransferase [Nitrosarchaeum sp.]|nr:class I SAM-dependent methyltransferase [Nitrosarchaeum sp.]
MGFEPFPLTSDIRGWNQAEIEEYRRRIMGVYFPEFRHSLFRESINEAYSAIVKSLPSRGQILYVHPWENRLIESIARQMSGLRLSVADTNPEYVSYLLKLPQISSAHLLSRIPANTFDVAVILHTLEFTKDRPSLLQKLSRSLRTDGKVHITIFNAWGLTALAYYAMQKQVFNRTFTINPLFSRQVPMASSDYAI